MGKINIPAPSRVRSRRQVETAVCALATLIVGSCKGGSDGPPEVPSTPAVVALSPVGAVTRVGTVGDTVPVLVVRAVDSEGRALPNARISFVTDEQGQFVSPTAVTDANGEARTNWRLGGGAGTQSARAMSGNVPSVVFTATATAGPPVSLGLRTQPAGSRVGERLSVAPVVDVRDRFGNVVPVPVTITALLASGPGVVAGTSTVSSPTGVATFDALSLGGPVGERVIRFEAPSLQSVASAPVLLRPAARSLANRADDVSGPQLKVYYVVPSDGVDRGLDTLPTIAYSMAVWQRWLSEKLGGRTIRLDTFNGALDVGFFQLSSTDASMVGRGAFVLNEIQRQMNAAGLLQSNRIYAVYYDGGSSFACGGASSVVAAMYLRGTPPGATCPPNALRDSPNATMGYWESAMLHDVVHTMGIVSGTSPNHTAAYPFHVPEPDDLMYTGPSPWRPGNSMVIDVNGDDYHGSNVRPGLPTILASQYVAAGLPLLAAGALTAPSSIGARSARDEGIPNVMLLPPHPPYPAARP